MNKNLYEKIIQTCLNEDCEFVEVYYEISRAKNYIMINSKLDDITTSNLKGLGIRIYKNGNIYYLSTDNLKEKSIMKELQGLLSTISTVKKEKSFKLSNLVTKKNKPKIAHNAYPTKNKIELLRKIDELIRKESKLISQVRTVIREDEKEFTIANSDGLYINSNELHTRIVAIAVATSKEKKVDLYNAYGKSTGYELLEEFNIEEFCKDIGTVVVKKLNATKFKGGKMPVVLGPGFTAVIFHEACGHGLEATYTSEGLSVFSNSLNQKIGSEKVTLIDDGTIPGEWGSTIIDTEGKQTQKNILIENGILKSFLVDRSNSKKMNHQITGSSRRENYKYEPTSRMNNTYLAAGTDTVDEIIKSVDYGVYCRKMSGGSVDIKTGDFNFQSTEAYLIEHGKITKILPGVTLIGKSQEILKNVEMVSNDLKIETGYCGSTSGTVPVTTGEPTIKISEILVGGIQ